MSIRDQAINQKNRITLFTSVLKVEGNEMVLIFLLEAKGPRYGHFLIFRRPILTVWAVSKFQDVCPCVCPRHFERFRDSNYFDCMKTMPKYKNDSIEGTQTQKRELCRSTSSNFLTNVDT